MNQAEVARPMTDLPDAPRGVHPTAAPGRPYSLHLFVCTTGPDCPQDGPAQEIRSKLKEQVKARGLDAQVRVNHSGCLGQCGHGPMMVVYPEGAWYAHLTTAEAMEVLEAHVDGDPKRVTHLRYRLGPGGMKAPRDETGRRSCDQGCRGGPR